MIIRSKAPLRLGLAGGGSDLDPYCSEFGGLVLNSTINLYSHCTIVERDDNLIQFTAQDLSYSEEIKSSKFIEPAGDLCLHKGVYNRIIKEFNLKPLSFNLTTRSDAPPGSGLGSSSAIVVCMVKAYVEWLNLPLGEYEIAFLAYQIEREDLKLSGGKQDQYAAAFGGFNLMEFYSNNRTIINPLRIKRWIVNEFESSIVLYFTGVSRSSAKIIDEQIKNSSGRVKSYIESTHSLKQDATQMKELLLKGEISSIGKILQNSWENKKRLANSITNSKIDEIMKLAKEAGAISGKVSGAGGGGFILFIVDPSNKHYLKKTLNKTNGNTIEFQFTQGGTHSWKIYN